MLATGGTLGSMAESGAGTLAGNAQADVWDQIVSRDAGIIAQAVWRALLRPFIEAVFPGRGVAVDFGFDLTKTPTPKEVFETAAAAKAAGYLVDQATLEEETGWKLEKAPEAPLPGGGIALNSGTRTQTPLKIDANPLQIAPRVLDTQGEGEGAEALAGALERVFLKIIVEGAADAVKNVRDANGMEHDAEGKFGKGGAGAAGKRERETKPQHDRYGLNDITRLAAEPARNAERAMAALDEVVRKRGGFVDKAAYRPECGWIRLDWGDAGDPGNDYKGGHGLAHIAAKHPDDLKHLPDVIAKGEAFRHPTDNTKTYFVHGERFAVVASLKKGAKKTITEYAPDRPKDIEAIKNYPRAHAPGKKGG